MPRLEDNRASVEINRDGGTPLVEFKYSQPNIAVDTSSRFVTHDIIGDMSVRQKIGEDPAEITVDGVCTEQEANDIDDLRQEDRVTLLSSRWSGIAQVSSTSTQPLADGGAMDNEREWVHRFTIELVEIEDDLTLELYWSG